MNKKTLAFLLCAGVLPLSQTAVAQSDGPQAKAAMCFTNSQDIYPGIAAPGEYRVVHGPFTTKCGTTMHKFKLRHQSGMLLPVTVEKLVGGGWVNVINQESDPTKKLGNGTFRMILDNTENTASTPYKGSYSVPL
jgi:hypothetical protein